MDNPSVPFSTFGFGSRDLKGCAVTLAHELGHALTDKDERTVMEIRYRMTFIWIPEKPIMGDHFNSCIKSASILAIVGLPALFGCVTERQLPEVSNQKGNVRYEIAGKRTTDFRYLFRPPEVISRLEANLDCEVRVRQREAFQEFHVGYGIRLDELLTKFIGNHYDGQAKVISRNQIVQTPRWDPEADKQQQQIIVHPGDLVFVMGWE